MPPRNNNRSSYSSRAKDLIFPEVTPDIQAAIVFWIWMFGIIAASNVTGLKNQYGAINPVVMFTMGLFALGFVAFRQADTFGDLKEVLGFEQPIPGFGILSLLNGLGVGILFYTLYTGRLLAVARGPLLTSVAQPFYIPYTASATAYSTSGFTISTAVFGILFFMAYVAFFEEAYKVGIFKIVSNWLHSRLGISPGTAMLIALFATFILWSLWHFFSWNGLSLVSIIFAVVYGLVFYSGYFIMSSTNLLPKDFRVSPATGEVGGVSSIANVLSGVVIYAPIGAHFSWNVLVSLEGAGIPASSLNFAGFTLFSLSLLGMYVSRQVYG